jgi:hypothetical protein
MDFSIPSAHFPNVWQNWALFRSRLHITLEQPFHTPLHVHQALLRAVAVSPGESDFAHHATQAGENGSLHLTKDFFGSLEDGLFTGTLPSHISFVPQQGRRENAAAPAGVNVLPLRHLHVLFGSPNKVIIDVVFSCVFAIGLVDALVSGSHILAAALGVSLAAGLIPATLVEFRARRRFARLLQAALKSNKETRIALSLAA